MQAFYGVLQMLLTYGTWRMFNADSPVNFRYSCVVDHWDRLKKLKLYNLQRRRERYMLCYMYKIHIGMVPDLGFLSDNGRQGVKYFAKENNQVPAGVQSLRT